MDYLAGILGQYIRSLSINVYLRESIVVLLASLVASVSLYMSADFESIHSVREFLLALRPYFGQVAVGLVGTSMAANFAVKAGVNADHPMIPVTSKEG